MLAKTSVAASIALFAGSLLLAGSSRAQNDGAVTYKTNCTLCHGPDGSGNSPTGKALGAKDLRSEVVRKESNADLAAVISAGRNKMPAFGKKLKPHEIQKLVMFVKALPQ